MTVVYIDTLFFLNLTANYLLLLAGGRMAGVVLRRGWILLGAGLGAGYAAALFLPDAQWLAAWPLRIAVGAVMCLAAYGKSRDLLRAGVMFSGASAGLAGLVLAAQLLGSSALTVRQGAFYSETDLRLLLVLFGLCYFILSLFFRRIGRHGGGELVRLEVWLRGQRVGLTALRDTGHTLTEPGTNRPVVVADCQAVRHCLPGGADPRAPVESMKRLHEAGIRGYQLLPFRAVGTQFGVLLAVKAERVTANGSELGPLLIALSPGPVSDGGGYQGLIGGI